MNRRATFQEVADFIVKERQFTREKIGCDTLLRRDLGLDGDEAVDFFEGFHRQFGVDLTGIQWKRHFGDEGFNPFLILWPPFWHQRARMKDIRVLDLVAAAEAGRWAMTYDDEKG